LAAKSDPHGWPCKQSRQSGNRRPSPGAFGLNLDSKPSKPDPPETLQAGYLCHEISRG
jgi:hypothetical protein